MKPCMQACDIIYAYFVILSGTCLYTRSSAADKWKLCAFDDKIMKLGTSTIHIWTNNFWYRSIADWSRDQYGGSFFEKGAWPNFFSSLSTKRTINFENIDVVHCIYCVSCKQLSFCQLELQWQQPLWCIAAIFRAICFVVSFWFYSDLFKAKCFWKVKNISWTIYQLVKIQSDSFIPRTAGYFPQIYRRTGPGGGGNSLNPSTRFSKMFRIST